VILDATAILTGIQLLVFGLLAEMIKMIEIRVSQERRVLDHGESTRNISTHLALSKAPRLFECHQSHWSHR
jgi:hypothetical protein